MGQHRPQVPRRTPKELTIVIRDQLRGVAIRNGADHPKDNALKR